MNTGTLTLYPYLESGTWVFDDERTGLKEEAFVHVQSNFFGQRCGGGSSERIRLVT